MELACLVGLLGHPGRILVSDKVKILHAVRVLRCCISAAEGSDLNSEQQKPCYLTNLLSQRKECMTRQKQCSNTRRCLVSCETVQNNCDPCLCKDSLGISSGRWTRNHLNRPCSGCAGHSIWAGARSHRFLYLEELPWQAFFLAGGSFSSDGLPAGHFRYRTKLVASLARNSVNSMECWPCCWGVLLCLNHALTTAILTMGQKM